MRYPVLRRVLLLSILLLPSCSSPVHPPGTTPPGSGGSPGGPDAEALAALDRQATALALQVAGGNVNALDQALKASGIAVRRVSGEMIAPPAQPALGLALADHDPEALAHLQARGGTITLQDLADTLKVVWPQADAARLPALIQSDLRAGVESTVPTVRFWSRLVVALGASTPAGATLLTSAAPGEVTINAAQQSLLLLRLAGGTARLAQSRGAAVPTQPAAGVRALSAAAPCTFGGTEGTIMDGAATAITTGVGELLGYLDSVSALPGESAADAASGLLSKTNLILSYLKFTLTLASFRLDLSSDTDTVERTRSTTHNGEGVVTARAKVSYDLGASWQYANCFRLAFNAAGLDFSSPNAGVVEGADVRWRIFAAQGDGSYADQHLSVIAARAGEEVMHDKTDGAGVAEVHLEGLKQSADLGPAPTAVMKRGEVSAVTSIKTASIASDLVDAIGSGLGGVGGLLGMPAELMYRMWPLSSTLALQVRDWAPTCANVQGDTCWLGTVTVEDHRLEQLELRDPNKQPAGLEVTRADTSAVYTITSGSGPGAHSHTAVLRTQGTFQSHYAHHLKYDATYDVVCADEKTHRTNVEKNTVDEESSAQTSSEGTLSLSLPPDGPYTLSLSYMYGAKTEAVPGHIHSTAYFKGGCNPYADTNTSHDMPNERTHAWGGFDVEGQAHTENGVTSLAGSKTLTLQVDGLPTTRTVTWQVQRITVP
ncbi:hypothetical protein [Deinococcus sonorensis]|uniref:Uncharacterized protein n=2 Tax=Deinococcus sonorensis TaxID=309891 RepID=A0AAU7U695_9DEIO